MDKEKILQMSREENEYIDEGEMFYYNKGTYKGFIVMTILYLLYFFSCVFVDKQVVLKESLLSMYLCFLSARTYSKYEYSKKKHYLYFAIFSGVITVILAIETLYWIWVK